jgi:hypothetical protein
MRSYFPKAKTWSIWWLDGRSPTQLDTPVVGSFQDGVGLFFADDVLNGQPIKVRFTWTAVPGQDPRWEQAFSNDAGKTWETNWTMRSNGSKARPDDAHADQSPRQARQVLEHWQPRVVAEMNDYQFKLAKLQGEFIWHCHDETDEVFIVIQGQLRIEFRDGFVDLGRRRDVRRAPLCRASPGGRPRMHIMLVEPRGVVNTGSDSSGKYNAPNDVWYSISPPRTG